MLHSIFSLHFFVALGNQVSSSQVLLVIKTFVFPLFILKIGEDGDACFELLVQALESLRSLPPTSIFHLLHQRDNNTFGLWFRLLDKSTSFLRSIVFEYA